MQLAAVACMHAAHTYRLHHFSVTHGAPHAAGQYAPMHITRLITHNKLCFELLQLTERQHEGVSRTNVLGTCPEDVLQAKYAVKYAYNVHL